MLFNLFLNDLTEYFRTNQCTGITIQELDDNLFLFLKIFLLLYADAKIIIADSAANLQFALNIYCSYCETWKLHINYTKTKNNHFSKGEAIRYVFTMNSNDIEIVKFNEYKYLGVLFSSNNSFTTTKKQVAEQGSRAMYSLLRKARNMHLPIDLQI